MRGGQIDEDGKGRRKERGREYNYRGGSSL